MDRNEFMRRIREAKIPLLILCAAVFCLLVTGKREPQMENSECITPDSATETAERRLSELLETIDGVGKCGVLLSVEYTAEEEYLSDAGETVILSSGSGTQTALPRRIRAPRYLGAVVTCRGGDRTAVQLAVTEAVAQFTGLGADRITVLKLAD